MRVKQERQCTFKPNIEARSHNDFCCGKAISITYSECVYVALIMQHAKRMRRITLQTAACLAVSYFSEGSHNRHDLREEVIEHKMCVMIFSKILPENFLIVRRIKRDVIINVQWSSCKVPEFILKF
jgi:hypothetical protein